MKAVVFIPPGDLMEKALHKHCEKNPGELAPTHRCKGQVDILLPWVKKVIDSSTSK